MATPAKKFEEKLPKVVIVGRTNVGKSTLFNRLVEAKDAIVSEEKGTTRTRNEKKVVWRGHNFKLIDTGGIDFDSSTTMEEKIKTQANKALKEADVIIFLTSGKGRVLKQEKRIAKKLQKSEVPVILAANKIDNKDDAESLAIEDWYRLGFGDPIKVSALNGRNAGKLLDEVHNKLKEIDVYKEQENQNQINVSIIGKPNAGKSTLFNKLIGDEEVIVSEQTHTTREPYGDKVVYNPKDKPKENKQIINFIDTAGIRKKKNIKEGIETTGVNKSIDAIERSNVVLFMIDGTRKVSKQDKKLGNLLKNKLKSVIILINKWDLAENGQEKQNYVKEMFYKDFPHLDFAPIVFVSALTGLNVHRIFPNIEKAWKARNLEIPTEALNSFLETAAKKHEPQKGKGTKEPKLLDMKQVSIDPIVFELYINKGSYLADNYINYLKNRLRDQFGFFATPVRIKLKK